MRYLGAQPTSTSLTQGALAADFVTEAMMANDAIGLPELKSGTDGELITWDASGNPAAVGAGTAGHFLKSQGAGSVPVFAEAGGGAHAQVVTASSATVTTTTSGIPQDDTIPQSSEGVEVLTLAISPTNASSVLNIFVHVPVWGTAGGGVGTGFALFKDSVANAIAAGTCSTGGIPNASFSLHHNISAGSTSSQTFKLRIGAGGSGTVGINSNSAATRTYGGVAATTMTIFEVLP